MTTTETELKKLAVLIMCLEDIFHSYETVKNNEAAKAVVYEFASLFHVFSAGGDSTKERMYEIFEADSIFDALPQAKAQVEVERKGRMQFQLICGAMYRVIDVNKEFIATASHTGMAAIVEQIRGLVGMAKAEASTKKGFARQKANKEVKKVQADLAKAEKQYKQAVGKSINMSKSLLKLLKPLVFKGGLLENFIKEVDKIK